MKRRCQVLPALLLAMMVSAAHAQTCPFDDGNSSLAVEGLILTRYALGITGAPLVMSTGINAVDAPTVEAAINCPSCGLNITGNATLTVADATIISRKLAGFSGDALTNGVALGSGTRNTPAAVQSFLLAGCGATGGTVTSITAGTGLTGGTITGSGTIAADTTYLQRRVVLGCGAGAAIRSIDADGLPSCVSAGGGTVTGILTGPGLTGGPISGAGTINLASTQLLPTTACATDQIAKWSGSAWVCTAASRTLPTCMLGQVIRVGIGGALQCGNLPHSIATHRKGTDRIGYLTAIAIGDDALPVVVYYHTDASIEGTVRALKCGNSACTSGNTDSVVQDANPGAVEVPLAVAIGADNFPIIVVRTSSFGFTRAAVVKCGNASCSSISAVTTIGSTDQEPGRISSIVVPPDGRPAITYSHGSNGGTLKVTKCGNAACSNGNAVSVVDTVRAEPSIALGTDGLPVIAYYDLTGQRLKVAKCADASCASSSISIVDGTGTDVGSHASITVPVDGRPIISYFDAANGELKVARCGNAACSSGNIRTVVDTDGTVGKHSSIAIGADGLPVVSYYDETNGALKFVKCSNANCSSSVNRTISTVESDGGAGLGLGGNLAMPADGLPVISYSDVNNRILKIAKCSNAACVFP
ncbi:MAG: hypothetical protein EAZ30_11930 [Betaproteobacteria bacterium]|nr:MAG: hypothetical protein EAZ30_11930 [Betaproteobacteria bacterium]